MQLKPTKTFLLLSLILFAGSLSGQIEKEKEVYSLNSPSADPGIYSTNIHFSYLPIYQDKRFDSTGSFQKNRVMIDGIEFMAGRVHLGYERILDSGKSGLRLEAEIPLNDSRNHCERFYILDVSSSCFYATPKWMFFTGFNLDEEAFFPKWAGTFRWNYYYRNEEAVKNYGSSA